MISTVGMMPIPTVNPGDRILDNNQSVEEKSKQLAVHAPDITGDYLEVPTYFVVDYGGGEKKALHHVRDAQQISDVVRLLTFSQDNDDNLTASSHHTHNFTVILLIVGLCLATLPILIGIF